MRTANIALPGSFENISPLKGTYSLGVVPGPEPEPVGTILLLPHRIVGYTLDETGRQLATIEPITKDGQVLTAPRAGYPLSPEHTLVVEDREELQGLFTTDP